MFVNFQSSGIGTSHISFKEVLDRLLMIVSYPVRQMLVQDQALYPGVLVANTCSLLSTIVSELAATATGLEVYKLCCCTYKIITNSVKSQPCRQFQINLKICFDTPK